MAKENLSEKYSNYRFGCIILNEATQWSMLDLRLTVSYVLSFQGCAVFPVDFYGLKCYLFVNICLDISTEKT